MSNNSHDYLRVSSLEELERKGCTVIRGADRPICLFYNDGKPCAVDNRCPHMGFPLHRGTLQDGMITCHWHHARFDSASGCTFDLFADDVPAYDVEVRDGVVWVANYPRERNVVEHSYQRLQQGMEQNISLISAKAILDLQGAGVDYQDIVREIGLFGVRYRDGWAMGMTIMTAMANLVPHLGEETAYLALYQGARRVANDCAGQVPRRDRHALETDELPLKQLEEWLPYWTVVRHRDGAERTLLTAIENDASREELTKLIFSAATERPMADMGHVVDFCNKSFELLDLIGWEHASAVLPTTMAQLVAARGGEEMNAWRHPLDLIPLVKAFEERLPSLLEAGAGKTWSDEAGLAKSILGEDPEEILAAIAAALEAGATPEQLGKAVAYAASQRIARFGMANEFGDWIVALHTFTYCNAMHLALKRCPDASLVRGAVHGAISVYLDRFLNVPPAHLPGERDSIDDEPTDAAELLAKFLESLDSRENVHEGARVVARYLALGHPIQPLIDTLTIAVLREDANFHTFQMVEAATRQYHEWGDTPEGRDILVAAARYLAAHAPTERAQHQTARIALRLHRGEDIYEEEDVEAEAVAADD